MRKTALEMVYDFAKQDERIVFIGSDLSQGTLERFRKEMPDRFFIEGVCEANIIGMAAGLAAEGRIVYVNTLAVFLTRRAYEQIALDLCLHNLNVRLIGNGGGLVYAPLGPTHLAIEDFALMRAVPNMTILAPADADEMRRFMPLTVDHQGPVYIRLGKGNEAIVTPEDEDAVIGKAVPIRNGADVLLVSTGVTLGIAREAAARLSQAGCEAAILHCPTVKPIDAEAILAAAGQVPFIITLEEHVRTGGLGSAVAELVAETQWDRPKRVIRLALPDAFTDKYGSQAELLELAGLTPEQVVSTARSLRGESARG